MRRKQNSIPLQKVVTEKLSHVYNELVLKFQTCMKVSFYAS